MDGYQKILADSLWHFMGKYFNTKEWDPKINMDEIDMNTANF